MEDQVTQATEGTQDQQIQQQSLGWRAALPSEFKEHDFVKTFSKPGDFVKSALEIKTERDALKTKLEKAIFRPGEKATPEEMSAFQKAFGVPEKPGDYEFPKGSKVEHDEKMISWAKDTFHKAGLNKDQAGVISQAWDGFITGMAQAREEGRAKAMKESESKLKTEWGANYDTNREVAGRAFTKFSNAQFNAFVEDTGIGNHPILIKAFYEIGKAMGEDASPKGSGTGTPKIMVGMGYKIPNPSQTG